MFDGAPRRVTLIPEVVRPPLPMDAAADAAGLAVFAPCMNVSILMEGPALRASSQPIGEGPKQCQGNRTQPQLTNLHEPVEQGCP